MECERASGNVESESLSREEEDKRKRDTKKINYGQEDHAVNSRIRVSCSDIGRDSDPNESHSQEEGEVQRRSYIESLLRGQGKYDNGNPNVTKGNGNIGETENVEHGNREERRLSEPFDKALIIKLLGRNIGFKVLERKLYQMWSAKGILTIIDLTNDYFLVKFSCLEDYDAVLENGPWVIFDHYLTIRPWSPGFDPSIDMIQKLAIWVRFPDLPIEFFDNKFLRCFGNQLGKTVKVDATTSLQDRGRYAWKVQKEKYGAWMRVSKSRRTRVGKNMEVSNQHKKPANGRMERGGPSTVHVNFRFEVLANDEENLADMETWNGEREARDEVRSDKGKGMVVASTPTHSDSRNRAASSRRYFGGNLRDNNDLSGPSKVRHEEPIKLGPSSRGLSDISETRLSSIKKFMREGNSAQGEKSLSNMQEHGSKLREGVPNDFVMDDTMEGRDSEDEELSTFVPCTIQREEDLRQIDEVVELLEMGPKAQGDGRGFAGGIWVGWNEDFSEVEVIESDLQYVHLKVREASQVWRFIDNVQDVWALIGDFNDILSASEKKGGAPFNLRKAQKFVERIDACNLMDMPTAGSRFTWRGPHTENRGKRKRELLARLDGIQKNHNISHNPFLERLESDLQNKLDEVLKQEVLWYQKSWGSMAQRRRPQHENDGEWVQDEESLLNLATSYFRTLYCEDTEERRDLNTRIGFPQIDDEEVKHLEMGIFEDEVRNALFSMKGLKAPGIDGDVPLDAAEASVRQVELEVYSGGPEEIKLPETLITLIMNCIMTSKFRLLWNGGKTDEFSPTRGLRQGDPLSPYIFVLCMEKLAHLIQERVDENSWHTMRAGRSGPSISHLVFADDIILFSEATMDQAQVILQCLSSFGEASGQKVNTHKTSIYFSKNTNPEKRQQVLSLTNFGATQDIGKYLGMPILHNRVTRHTFNFLVDKVRNCLAGWKRNCLSLAGRVTLAKSVISAVPYYAMQSTRIPKVTCSKIEKLQRNFVWGHLDNVRKPHPISWKTVCSPKESGGLGIKRLTLMNNAFIMKMGWKLKTEDNNLCVKVLRGKYGRSVNWIERTPLIQQASMIPDEITASRSVASYCTVSGGWKDWDMEPFLGQDAIDKILSELPPNPVRGPDKLCWGVGGDGRFSVRKAYQSIACCAVPDRDWKWIWKVLAPERIKLFLWQVLHQRLATNLRLCRWSDKDAHCNWCSLHEETTLHVLRDCYHAVKIWRDLVHPSKMTLFFSTDFNAWINLNRSSNLSKVSGVDWIQIWSVGMWMLWFWRNKASFKEGFSRPPFAHRRVMDYVTEINNAKYIFDTPRVQVLLQEVLVAWEKPREGWIKINSDGAVKTSYNKARCGALIRDHNGTWISGVIRNLVNYSVLKTEAWGAFEGIKLARDLGYRKIILESDSQCLINIFMSGSSNIMEVYSIIQETLLIFKDFDDVRVQHRWREANSCADFLANLGTVSSSVRFSLQHPPSGVSALLLADALGIQVPRVIPS
ncbi:RNA-directed DNA polymerase [Senna tora]|uniref:RNA-directed DNA polymerase n=1 Tax=Senna tora TaxID=362788 RepID=A0A834SYW4_9FABA|nr:RNA-directed DNA polymerase [Senna tora]